MVYSELKENIPKEKIKSLESIFKKLLKFDFKRNLDYLQNLLDKHKEQIFKKFILVTTISPKLFKKNFILSGLNLAFLGHYVSKELDIYKNMYHWPDGLFKFVFFKKKYIWHFYCQSSCIYVDLY